MQLKIPKSLHYPLTVTQVFKKEGENVKLNDPLFEYSYEAYRREGDRYGNEKDVLRKFSTRFESPFEGKLKNWRPWEKEVISEPVVVCDIEEACTHKLQYAGMCADCGMDMTSIKTYNADRPDSDRAQIQMSHTTQQLKVSQDEASKVEEATKDRLLTARKLSLVVDLDQTIIHATVDSTIAMWQDDKDNPNYDAVKDVEKFQLEEAPGMRGTWYFIKLRPGLQHFFEEVSKLYELHIYTMGTRQYAQRIAQIVDPEGIYFADRILSRDESGSMTAKSLQRLFPGDQSMVVIIDDRGDVWRWSDNLIKVHPFDFFVGIGDINSVFLPKRQEIPALDPSKPEIKVDKIPPPDEDKPSEAIANGEGVEAQATLSTTVPMPAKSPTSLEQIVSIGSGNDSEVLQEQATEQREQLAAQLEEKPLLQMQKAIDEKDEAVAAEENSSTSSAAPSVNGITSETSTQSDRESVDSDSSTSSKPPQRHALLKNDDNELVAVQEHLTAVHATFYNEYDQKRRSLKGGRVGSILGKRKQPLTSSQDDATSEIPSDLQFAPDIKNVMPFMKWKVLDGVVITFSAVIPLLVDVQQADISQWAKSFGARVSTKVSRDTTHVVAAKAGTAKVKQAVRRGNIKIVQADWLRHSLSRWERLDEAPYLIDTSGLRLRKGGESPDDEKRRSERIDRFFMSDESDSETDDMTTDTDLGEDERANKRSKRNGDFKPGGINSGDSDDVMLEGAIPTNRPDKIGEPDDSAESVVYERGDANDQAALDAELREFLGDDGDLDSDTDTESTRGRDFAPTNATAKTTLRTVVVNPLDDSPTNGDGAGDTVDTAGQEDNDSVDDEELLAEAQDLLDNEDDE
ncbi:MAG: hypothetical protein Q9160_001189 [Pyrenula sp. 1 TL-2023]